MEITILGSGTSQGVPVIACDCVVCKSQDLKDKRLRSAIMIEINGKNIVIDAGPDFRQQMLRENVKNIRAVLVTHGHKDHIGGLDDIRAFNWVNRGAIDLYSNEFAIKDIYKDFSYAFTENKLGGLPEINIYTVDDSFFWIDDIKIIPITVMHYKLPILAYRIENFAYITDAKTINATELEKLRGVEILIINALRKEEHISHLTLNEAIDIIKEINPQKAYITHIGHQMGLNAEVNNELPENIFLAYDGMKINI